MFWWLYTILCWKNPFFGKPTNDFFPLQVYRMVPKNFEISTIEKYDVSAFQRTFERPSTTSRSKVIPFWSSKIPLSVSFPQMHQMPFSLISINLTKTNEQIWSRKKNIAKKIALDFV